MPRYQFGVFDFVSETGELRRDGLPVRLQAQPAQVLALLLATPAQLVTRDALRTAVWGTETFVDFDRGLNFCIAQIRSALGDSADSPRYIRTQPRKGYQFIAPVTTVPPSVSTASPSDPAASPNNSTTPPPQSPPPEPARPRARGFLPLTLVLILAMLGWQAWQTRRPSTAAPPAVPAVAVFRLDNNTGDPAYDRLADILTDSLIAELTDAGTRAPSPDTYTVIGNAADLRRPRAQRDLLAVGSALHTPWTVSGSIRNIATPVSGIEVFAQLVTIPDGKHVKVVRLPLPPNALDQPPADTARKIAETFHPFFRQPHISP